MKITYKIKDTKTGLYSQGAISKYRSKEYKKVVVGWSKKGKEWTSEKFVKDHLLKCIQFGGIPESWEILQCVEQPTKPINEWVDNKMLIKMLKLKHTK